MGVNWSAQIDERHRLLREDCFGMLDGMQARLRLELGQRAPRDVRSIRSWCHRSSGFASALNARLIGS